jgi:hypothetical protein
LILILFYLKKKARPTVNNVTILSDHQLPNGNQVFLISEVLFVSEAIVSRLHQMNKDKESRCAQGFKIKIKINKIIFVLSAPPLLAFPWFGAQFLSHSFLALELDNRFKHATRSVKSTNRMNVRPYVQQKATQIFQNFMIFQVKLQRFS